ncbi:hypothetical protein BYT27DRAFT_7192140 [Phlegmacium glaucopus]|nr:hypothetical protein BYT27DRAFT_7192140 [Phlegmacium glaucopus]
MPRAQVTEKRFRPTVRPLPPNFNRPRAHRFTSSPPSPSYLSPTASSSSETTCYSNVEHFDSHELDSILKSENNLKSIKDILWDRSDLNSQFCHYFETRQTIRRLEKEIERQRTTTNLLFDHMREGGLILKLKPLIRHHRKYQWSSVPFKNTPQETNVPVYDTPSPMSSPARSIPNVPIDTIILPVTPHISISEISTRYSEGDGSRNSPIYIPDDEDYQRLQVLDTMRTTRNHCVLCNEPGHILKRCQLAKRLYSR